MNSLLTKENKSVEEENKEDTHGQDMDEESTAQNFKHIARQGDLSPRVMDKVKSAGRGKKRNTKKTLVSRVLVFKQEGQVLNQLFNDECINMEH